MRKGYLAEYEAKQKLIKQYGRFSVLKLAIGQAADFIVLKPHSNKVEKIVEIKKRKTKYYLNLESSQWQRIAKMSKRHDIPVELWQRIKGNKEFKIIKLKF
jgi:diphthamide synthase subunit DPH2